MQLNITLIKLIIICFYFVMSSYCGLSVGINNEYCYYYYY